MSWDLLRLPELGAVQWVDLPIAEDWRCEMRRILRAAGDDPDVLPAPNRQTFLRELAQAIGQFARACDLPLPALEPFDRRLRAALQVGRAGLAGLGPTTRNGAWLMEAETALLGAPGRVSEIVRGDALYTLTVIPRVSLSASGEFLGGAEDSTSPPEAGMRGVDWRGWLCPAGAAAGDPWRCLAVAAWWPGLLDSGEPEIRVLAPLRWSWDLLIAVATELVTRPVRETVLRCRAWVADRNSRTLEWLGQSGAEPSAIVRVAGEWEAGRWSLPRDTQDVVRGLQAFAGALAVANPIAGAVVGALVSLPEIFVRAFGLATQFETDVWGRRLPLYERASLSGEVVPRQRPPTHPLLDAPPWGRCVQPSTDAIPARVELVALPPEGRFLGLVFELGRA